MIIELPAKRIRAKLIAAYVKEAGYRGVVCFSCGNASKALSEVDLYNIDVSPSGCLEARRWWTPADIHRCWPDLFDATSGHLPAHIMVALAHEYKVYLGKLSVGPHEVPTGSGETITCLRWAYAHDGILFVPKYGEEAMVTYEPQAPLNCVVNGF